MHGLSTHASNDRVNVHELRMTIFEQGEDPSSETHDCPRKRAVEAEPKGIEQQGVEQRIAGCRRARASAGEAEEPAQWSVEEPSQPSTCENATSGQYSHKTVSGSHTLKCN